MAPTGNAVPPSTWQTLALLGYFMVLGIALSAIGMYYKRRKR